MNFLNGLKKLPDFSSIFPIHPFAKDFPKKIIYGGGLSSTLKLSSWGTNFLYIPITDYAPIGSS